MSSRPSPGVTLNSPTAAGSSVDDVINGVPVLGVRVIVGVMYCGSPVSSGESSRFVEGLSGNRSFTSSFVTAVVPEFASTSERARTDVGAKVMTDAMTASAANEADARRTRVMSEGFRLSSRSRTTVDAVFPRSSDASCVGADNRCLLNLVMSTFCPLWLCLWMNHRIDTNTRTARFEDLGWTHDRPATRSCATTDSSSHTRRKYTALFKKIG